MRTGQTLTGFSHSLEISSPHPDTGKANSPLSWTCILCSCEKRLLSDETQRVMEHSWLEYEPTFARKATALALGTVFRRGGRNPTWAKEWASPLLAPGLLSLCPEMGFQPRKTLASHATSLQLFLKSLFAGRGPLPLISLLGNLCIKQEEANGYVFTETLAPANYHFGSKARESLP